MDEVSGSHAVVTDQLASLLSEVARDLQGQTSPEATLVAMTRAAVMSSRGSSSPV